MNIYKVSRTDEVGYDEFDSFVVVAKSNARARMIMPHWDCDEPIKEVVDKKYSPWIGCEEVKKLNVEFIGKAKGKERLVLCSFNAG